MNQVWVRWVSSVGERPATLVPMSQTTGVAQGAGGAAARATQRVGASGTPASRGTKPVKGFRDKAHFLDRDKATGHAGPGVTMRHYAHALPRESGRLRVDLDALTGGE